MVKVIAIIIYIGMILLLQAMILVIAISIVSYVSKVIAKLKRKYITSLAKKDNSNWRDKLSKEELQIIDDAVELIKKVDSNIVISDFVVHKVNGFVYDTGFFLDRKDIDTLNIYIPFNKFFKMSKDFCFIAVLHEILHSQNLRTDMIFRLDFLEGINHWFATWLIENYSETYKIPTLCRLFTIRLTKKKGFALYGKYNVYNDEVAIVQEVFDKSDVDVKEAFLNYLDNNKRYFRSFVPTEYFLY